MNTAQLKEFVCLETEKRRLEGEVATTVEPKAQVGQGAKGGPGGPTGAGVVGAAGVAAPTRDGPGVSS